MGSKRFKEPVGYLERASGLDPRDPDLLRRQVICQIVLGDKPAATTVLLAHLEQEPDFRPGWGLLRDLEPTAEEMARAEENLNRLDG